MTRIPEFMTTAIDDITMTTETAAIVVGVIDVTSDVIGSKVWFSIPSVVFGNDVEFIDGESNGASVDVIPATVWLSISSVVIRSDVESAILLLKYNY